MPKLTEVRLSYSVGMKANIGNYESADFHINEGETWDVSDLSTEEVATFVNDRHYKLREKLGEDAALRFEKIHEGEI